MSLIEAVVDDLRQGFAAVFAMDDAVFSDPFDGDSDAPREIESESGTAVVWQFRAVHQGPFEGVPATERTITVHGTTVVVDGELALRHFDRVAVLAQMGARIYTRLDATAPRG